MRNRLQEVWTTSAHLVWLLRSQTRAASALFWYRISSFGQVFSSWVLLRYPACLLARKRQLHHGSSTSHWQESSVHVSTNHPITRNLQSQARSFCTGDPCKLKRRHKTRHKISVPERFMYLEEPCPLALQSRPAWGVKRAALHLHQLVSKETVTHIQRLPGYLVSLHWLLHLREVNWRIALTLLDLPHFSLGSLEIRGFSHRVSSLTDSRGLTDEVPDIAPVQCLLESLRPCKLHSDWTHLGASFFRSSNGFLRKIYVMEFDDTPNGHLINLTHAYCATVCSFLEAFYDAQPNTLLPRMHFYFAICFFQGNSRNKHRFTHFSLGIIKHILCLFSCAQKSLCPSFWTLPTGGPPTSSQAALIFLCVLHQWWLRQEKPTCCFLSRTIPSSSAANVPNYTEFASRSWHSRQTCVSRLECTRNCLYLEPGNEASWRNLLELFETQ